MSISMPGSVPLLVRLLSAWFRRVRMPESFESAVAGSGVTVVTQSASPVIEGLLRSFAARSGGRTLRYAAPGTPRPSERTGNHLWWVSLHDDAALEHLLGLEDPGAYVTLNIFARRGPIRTNPQNRLSLSRLLGITIAARLLVITLGDPVHPAEGRVRSRKRFVRLLKLDFYRNLKLVRGTPFQSIETQERILLSGAEFEREVDIIAAREKVSRANVTRRARAAFRELAANPRRTVYAILAPIVRFLLRRLFSGIKTVGLDRLVAANKEHTVIIVPMHRSHFDYLLVGSVLYDSNLNPPVVAAGINLSFWPFGFIIRSVGGYFVKRNARHDRLHAMCLRRYVSYLVGRGHLHEFFIEGGRSRSGRMRPPRAGLLGIMVDGALRSHRRPVLFMPCSITYEQVVEDEVLAEENTGQRKTRESLGSLFAARTLLRQRYGEVLLTFGEPLPIPAPTPARTPTEVRTIVNTLADNLTDRIRLGTSPSLSSLAYTALFMAPHYALRRAALSETVRGLARTIEFVRRDDPGVGAFTTSLAHFLEGRESLLQELVRGGPVHLGHVLGEEVLYIPGRRRFTADFYRNTVLHLFLPGAFLAAAELLDGAVSVEGAMKLHALFQHDYLLGSPEAFRALLARHLETLEREGLVAAGHFTTRTPGLFNATLLLGPLQTLLWIHRHLESACPDGAAHGCSLSELLEQLQVDFRTAAYLRLVTRTEASSRATLESALEGLARRGRLEIADLGRSGREVRRVVHDSAELALLDRANRILLDHLLDAAR